MIKELEIFPDQTLNIITGETGAGKSIMLGALGLLMGNRADVKALFSEEDKCVVEGVFEIKNLDLKPFFEENDIDNEDSCIIRREITPAGKSRAFVNDQPVNLDILKSLGIQLMDIHSQHDTQLLASNTYQLSVLDTFAKSEQELIAFKQSYEAFRVSEKALQKLKDEAAQMQKEFDYNNFVLKELAALKPENINQEELEKELKVLENAEDIKRRLSTAYESLNNAEMPTLQLLKDAELALGNIAGLSPKYQNLQSRIHSSFIELQDISQELEVENANVETDETKLEQIQDSLNQLYKLQKKHGVETVADLVSLKETLQQKVDTVLNLSEEIVKLEKQKAEKQASAEKAGQILSAKRKKAAPQFAESVTSILKDLGMPNAEFLLQIEQKGLSSDGSDALNFLFTANKGLAAKPLKDVASGGEFSRLMLTLKYIIAKNRQLPSIIFDEIDTGISGEVAVKVGNLLQEMSASLQVIAITHLPQISGKGNTHFFVYKDNSSEKTVSKMRKLSTEERIREIAIMIGGQNPSESALKSAKELLTL